MKNRLSKLLSVKSIITLVLTGLFAFCVLKNTMTNEFLNIYTMILSFYFGTQATKTAE